MNDEMMRRLERRLAVVEREMLRKRLIEVPSADAPATLLPVVTGGTAHVIEDGAGDRLILGPAGGDPSPGRPAFRMYASANLSVTTSTTVIATMDTVEFDTHDGIDLANSRYEVPAGYGGLWAVQYAVVFTANATGTRQSWISVSSNLVRETYQAIPGNSLNSQSNACGAVIPAAAGSTIRLDLWQTAGVTLTITHRWISGYWLGPAPT